MKHLLNFLIIAYGYIDIYTRLSSCVDFCIGSINSNFEKLYLLFVITLTISRHTNFFKKINSRHTFSLKKKKIQDILLFDWHAGKLYENENSLFQFFFFYCKEGQRPKGNELQIDHTKLWNLHLISY